MRELMALQASKLDEFENRARRNNVRVVGLPEMVEGPQPAEFLEKWFIETFGEDIFSPQFLIERAHRVPARAPPSGGRPRSILLKFLTPRTRRSS